MCASQITNIALVGIGSIGKRHHMAIEQIDNVNLAGIVDLSKHAKIYCDDKCFYLYKAKYILTFKGALVLYTIILLYGNTIGIFLSSLVLMTIIENLF